MNTSVDSFLDSSITVDAELSTDNLSNTQPDEIINVEGIDPRLLLLSHSSRGLLNKCPRKFQLYRLNSLENEADQIVNEYQQLTFDYGTFVGIGIQELLAGAKLNEVLLKAFLEWNVDVELRNDKQNKSLWEAVLAVQQFKSILDAGYLNDYELVEYNGKPAVELSFRIQLPNGFAYRGFIDGVLRHKTTGAIVVLEDKTTSYKVVNNAQYKNSGQALGYSIMLDHIFPGLSSYTVLYLVYSTPNKEYLELPFEKSAMQRAKWLTDLLIDTKKIELYEAFESYPMNGDFCYDFYRECEYLGLCTLSTERLVKPLTKSILDEIEKKEVYDFDFNFIDLVETQIEKNQ